MNFALPAKQKQLKSFLGLVNYFRDHVQGLFQKVKPLNEIMIPYKKGTSIDWTPRLEISFEDVQESVGNCPKLFYVDLNSRYMCTLMPRIMASVDTSSK